MCSGMGIEYRGKWKSENGKWTSGTVCWAHWSPDITGYVRTSTIRRSSPNHIENLDFASGPGMLRDMWMEQSFQVQRSVTGICAGLWGSKCDPAKSAHLCLA